MPIFFDAGQLYSDAAGFFQMAVSEANGLSMLEIRQKYAGAIAILMWRSVYDFFAVLGFPKDAYIGILVNISAVALTSVVTLKMARLIYANDAYRFNRLALLFSLCGVFWLFSGIHLRDAIALLAVAMLGYFWLGFLSAPGVGVSLLKVAGASILAYVYLEFLRDDFKLLPIVMALVALVASLFCSSRLRGRKIPYGVMAICVVGIFVEIFSIGDEILAELSRKTEGYVLLMKESQADGSLGLSLIIDQPLLMRLVLGFVYIYLFPIPFWSGFQLDSAYALFKSFNAIFFYFTVPLILMAIWQLWQSEKDRSVSLVFLTLLSLGYSMAIVGTSMETRHLGMAFPFLFLIALLPDLRVGSSLQAYKEILALLLLSVFFIHFSWVWIKFATI